MVAARKTYPSINGKAWWTLREKFLHSVPTKVTPNYLATVLGIQENSAKANVLPGLRTVGLLEGDGTPTQRANDWRDDERYAQVCKEIREEVYPPDLREAVPDPTTDRAAAENWFMRATGHGKNAAGKMAALYILLTTADPTAGAGRTSRASNRAARSRSAPSGDRPPNRPTSPAKRRAKPEGSQRATPQDPELPEMRLNLEIRIDASVTPEQIDQIFASMAKHLYGRSDERR